MLPAVLLLFGACCVALFDVLNAIQQIFKNSDLGVSKDSPQGDGGNEISICNFLHLV